MRTSYQSQRKNKSTFFGNCESEIRERIILLFLFFLILSTYRWTKAIKEDQVFSFEDTLLLSQGKKIILCSNPQLGFYQKSSSSAFLHSHLQHSEFWAAFFTSGQLRFLGQHLLIFSGCFSFFGQGHFRALPYWHPREACYRHTRKGLAHGQPLGSLGHTLAGLPWPRAAR